MNYRTCYQVLSFIRCILVESSTVICCASPFVIFEVTGLFRSFLWKILIANFVDPDQTPHDVASDLCLHCLPNSMTFYGVPGNTGLNCLLIS